jgi:hypothetical protein
MRRCECSAKAGENRLRPSLAALTSRAIIISRRLPPRRHSNCETRLPGDLSTPPERLAHRTAAARAARGELIRMLDHSASASPLFPACLPRRPCDSWVRTAEPRILSINSVGQSQRPSPYPSHEREL